MAWMQRAIKHWHMEQKTGPKYRLDPTTEYMLIIRVISEVWRLTGDFLVCHGILWRWNAFSVFSGY